MKDFEKIIKALANKRRLAIVGLIKRKGKISVGEISRAIKISFQATSNHLKILHAADIVDREQSSLTMYYSISKEISLIAKSISSHL